MPRRNGQHRQRIGRQVAPERRQVLRLIGRVGEQIQRQQRQRVDARASAQQRVGRIAAGASERLAAAAQPPSRRKEERKRHRGCQWNPVFRQAELRQRAEEDEHDVALRLRQAQRQAAGAPAVPHAGQREVRLPGERARQHKQRRADHLPPARPLKQRGVRRHDEQCQSRQARAGGFRQREHAQQPRRGQPSAQACVCKIRKQRRAHEQAQQRVHIDLTIKVRIEHRRQKKDNQRQQQSLPRPAPTARQRKSRHDQREEEQVHRDQRRVLTKRGRGAREEVLKQRRRGRIVLERGDRRGAGVQRVEQRHALDCQSPMGEFIPADEGVAQIFID